MTHKFDSEAIRQAAAGRSGEFRIICLSCQGGSDHEECLCINADTGAYVCKRTSCGIKGNFKHNTTEKKLKAAFIWEKSRIASEHPYTTRKQIHPSIIRVDMFGNWLNDYRDQHGNIQTVQMVNSEKVPGKPDKYFLSKEKNSGVGHTGAAYHIEGDPDTAYVCEGPATNHSIHEATGWTGYGVGGCSNFKHVVPWVMQKHKKVVVCADAGNGEADARKVAQEYNLPFAVPGIPGTDFNDMAIDAGADAVKSILENAQKPGPDQETPPKFKLVKYSDIEFKTPDYLIYGLMEVDSTVSIFSPPGEAKTFLAIDALCSVATGKDFHGRFTKQGPVIFVIGEGQNGIKRRCTAWSIRHQVSLDTAPIFISTMPTGLCDAEQVDHVIEAAKAVADEYGNPAMIVFDTVARNFGPGDENSTRDMTAFISGADKIRSAFKCCILLVHHSGHADRSRGRGSMALKGALDVEYRLEKDETGVVRVTVAKPPKDFEPPPPMAFRLNTVELPFQDDQGNPVTSAILDDTEYQPPPINGKQGRGKWQTVSVEILQALYKKHQLNLDAKGYDSDSARVLLDDWRKACMDKGMTRQTWKRIKDNLNWNSDIAQDGAYVRLISDVT